MRVVVWCPQAGKPLRAQAVFTDVIVTVSGIRGEGSGEWKCSWYISTLSVYKPVMTSLSSVLFLKERNSNCNKCERLTYILPLVKIHMEFISVPTIIDFKYSQSSYIIFIYEH